MDFKLRALTPEEAAEKGPNLIAAQLRGEHPGYRYLCGMCETVIFEGLKPEQLPGIIVPCPSCGASNEASVVPGYN